MNTSAKGRVLIVAGSDPSGGAGIQADIKTVTALGGYAAAAITALTVQNTVTVKDVMPVAGSFVAAQMRAVLEDVGADCIKTGMLNNVDVIASIVETLTKVNFAGPVIIDPVMVASSGRILMADDALELLKSDLIPKATLLTPNLPEAELLTGLKIETVADMEAAAKTILKLGAKAVLVKGGHLDSELLTDLLLTAEGERFVIETKKIDTRNTHGTGCTTASAIATFMAKGQALEQAFRAAHAFVQVAIKLAPGFGAGHGPLGHAEAGQRGGDAGWN
ncbi:MAG: bifunctional hydroxymethylpyrimidine kinase/phosphomethylpyrimidine kinase [Kordiimonadaceae bacterium]|nr:bifunctional hydroxymethylpyrimidine kinase/phosphomethylpyrimidine kinase [Kordiimonadaceae bacterium]